VTAATFHRAEGRTSEHPRLLTKPRLPLPPQGRTMP
jgi:hypothetical protein